LTAAGVGSGTDPVGVGIGAGCTTPLGARVVLGMYSQASVPPRINRGMPMRNTINGTTRRLSSSTGALTSGAASC
jgi:hypothetical protein